MHGEFVTHENSFKHAGYDAIVYRSNFGEQGYNLALFSLGDADAINCALYEVSAIEVRYTEIGNRWYSKQHLGSKQDP